MAASFHSEFLPRHQGRSEASMPAKRGQQNNWFNQQQSGGSTQQAQMSDLDQKQRMKPNEYDWLVVSNIFYFSIY